MLRSALLAVLCLCLAGVLVTTSPAANAVTIDWATVGNPGNPADTEVMTDGTTGYGSVGYTYLIGKYEITNAQYAEFLNAVARTDTYSLYTEEMDPEKYPEKYGGITRSGGAGSYSYSAVVGRDLMPVNHVSFYDALRFANWLHNGRLSGAQDSTTTEDGAYTFTGPTSVGSRNSGATIFLPSENEWYKAAYYDAVSMRFYDYPAGTDVQTICAVPGAMANTANCFPGSGASWVGDLTDVGSYTDAASPHGTFDQGGNVWEWNEAIINSNRGLRGGGFYNRAIYFAASYRYNGSHPPHEGGIGIGFRVAMIPEPSTGLLLATGLVGIALRRRLPAWGAVAPFRLLSPPVCVAFRQKVRQGNRCSPAKPGL